MPLKYVVPGLTVKPSMHHDKFSFGLWKPPKHATQTSMIDKNQPVSTIQFVAFDFETTGLQANRDHIVEFGAVKFQGGKVVDTFQALVDPGIAMSPEVSRISGITTDMLTGKPKLGEVLPAFLDFLKDSVLIAHNADFDAGFLRSAIQKERLSSLQNLIIDTVGLSKRAFPGQKSYSLQNLCAFLKFPPNQAHRALDDSVMCMKLFAACAEALSFMGDLPLADVIA